MQQADLVVLVALSNPRFLSLVELPVTEADIQRVFKPHPSLKNRKTLVLQRHIDAKQMPRALVYLDFFKGEFDAYGGIPVDSPAMLKYVEGIQSLQGKAQPQQLQYYLEHLSHKERTIAEDARDAFCHTEYATLRKNAHALPTEMIASVLRRNDLTAEQLSLLGFLLGHCGDKQHALLLRQKIKTAGKTRTSDGLDGLLIGYALLEPTQGLQLLRTNLRKEPKLAHWYANWRALTFFWDHRSNVLSEQNIIDTACQTLDGPWPDFAINELRRHKRGEVADRVLALWHKREQLEPIARKALLMYALVFRSNMQAAAIIEYYRRHDPETLRDAETALKSLGELP
jgi:hypothetical protein